MQNLTNAVEDFRQQVEKAKSQRPELVMDYENQTIALVEVWANQYAKHDWALGLNESTVLASDLGWLTSKLNWPTASASAFSLSLPCRDLDVLMGIVSRGAEFLTATLASPRLRPPIPSSRPVAEQATYSMVSGLMEAGKGGRVLFPGAECGYSCFMPPDASVMQQLESFGPVSDSVWVGVVANTLVKVEDGKIVPNETEIARLENVVSSLDIPSTGRAYHVYVRENPFPTFAFTVLGEEVAPGDAEQGGIGFNLDAVDAVVNNVWKVGLDALLPRLKQAAGGHYPISYMICNECYAHAPATPNSHSPSANLSLTTFQTFLSKQYQTIAHLNNAWHTSYSSFSGIRSYPAQPDPWKDGVSGGALRAAFDLRNWVRSRTAIFFGALINVIRGTHPDAMGHIKNKNYASFGNWDNGFDREALGAMLGAVGADTRSLPGSTDWTKVVDPLWTPDAWAFDWRSLAVGYSSMRAFGRTFHGNTPIQFPTVESEAHYTSTSDSRAIQPISFDHGRSTHLVATAAGRATVTDWFFPRKADGSLVHSTGEWGPGWSGVGSAAFSDGASPAYMAGMAFGISETNAGSGAMSALIRSDLPGDTFHTCVLFSNDNRVLGGNGYVAYLEGIAALWLAGVRSAHIITPLQLFTNASHTLQPCQGIFLPAINFADNATISAIHHSNLPIALIPANTSASPPYSLAFARDQAGEHMTPEDDINFLKQATTIPLAKAAEMAPKLAAWAHSIAPPPITTSANDVILKWAYLTPTSPSTSPVAILAVNVGLHPTSIDLSLRGNPPNNITSAATGIPLQPSTTLQPSEALFAIVS